MGLMSGLVLNRGWWLICVFLFVYLVDGFVVFEELGVIELDFFNLYVGEVLVFSFGGFRV